MESDISKYEECQSKMNYNNNSSSLYQDAQSKMNYNNNSSSLYQDAQSKINSNLRGASNKILKSNSHYEDAQNKIDYDPKINEKNNDENNDKDFDNNEDNNCYKENTEQGEDIKDRDFVMTQFENESNKKGACCNLPLPKCCIF